MGRIKRGDGNGGEPVRRKHRKRQHVGGFILGAPLLVERPDLVVIGKHQADQERIAGQFGRDLRGDIGCGGGKRFPVGCIAPHRIDI